MSDALTAAQEARVLEIVTNAIATALRGSDERIRQAIASDVLGHRVQMMPDEVRKPIPSGEA